MQAHASQILDKEKALPPAHVPFHCTCCRVRTMTLTTACHSMYIVLLTHVQGACFMVGRRRCDISI